MTSEIVVGAAIDRSMLNRANPGLSIWSLPRETSKCGALDTVRSAASVLSGEIPMWVNSVEALGLLRASLHTSEQVAAFAATVELFVHNALHSALVTLDGGSASAEVGRVYLVDEDGAHAPDGLHEFFVDHLFDSGRLP